MMKFKAWLLGKIPILIVMALIFSTIHYISFIKKQAAVAQARAAEMQHLVDVQTQSIEGLLAIRQRDSEALERLAGGFSSIERQMGNLSDTRKKLENENDQIKNYLDTPVPLELRGLYNGPADGADQD